MSEKKPRPKKLRKAVLKTVELSHPFEVLLAVTGVLTSLEELTVGYECDAGREKGLTFRGWIEVQFPEEEGSAVSDLEALNERLFEKYTRLSALLYPDEKPNTTAATESGQRLTVRMELCDLRDHLFRAEAIVKRLRKAYKAVPKKDPPATFRLWAKQQRVGFVNVCMTATPDELMDQAVTRITRLFRGAGELLYEEEDLGREEEAANR